MYALDLGVKGQGHSGIGHAGETTLWAEAYSTQMLRHRVRYF